jgi:hypothetical protein
MVGVRVTFVLGHCVRTLISLSLTRADLLSREVLPTVVCLNVIRKTSTGGSVGSRGLLSSEEM